MKMPGLIRPLALVFFASTGWAVAQPSPTADMTRRMTEPQARHISANVPPDDSFVVLLQRDVRAYLVANKLPSRNLEIEPLRKGATQSGASYPKYYVWVRAVDGAGHHIAGAMRVAAIEQSRFEVTDFTTTSAIQTDPASLASIYPALLLPAIRQRTAAR